MEEDFLAQFKPYKDRLESYHQLPQKGRDKEDIFKELEMVASEEDAKWKNGRCSGTYYHAGAEHLEFLNRVSALYTHVNAIQIDTCPIVFKMESEIVSMTAKMLNGDAVKSVNPDDEVCGTITSGGSESILMAMKVYRDWALKEKGITKPEIIKPRTAHPAFVKAGKYFGIKVVEAPVLEPDYMVDTNAVRSLINENTVALIGSAGNYPFGLIDPFEELSEIALEHGIGLHADGCLGGFILPWAEKLGYHVPTFDFRLPGLTSMSADTHKFGFGLKGTSVVLYRNKALRRHQYFQAVDFQGGTYMSPSMSGSRSGGLTAAAWATMVYLGEEGYMKTSKAILSVADGIKKAVREIPELRVVGEPTFIVSFVSDELDVFHINDHMAEKGWRFNTVQKPAGLHFCATMPQTLVPDLAEQFSRDLKSAAEYARENKGTPAKSSALYGMSATIEGQQMLSELLFDAIDYFYTVV
jgi:sphinganine-1-phosphate aldolase